jgi:hypothetical protein
VREGREEDGAEPECCEGKRCCCSSMKWPIQSSC